MSSSATGVGMPICFLGAILLILTQKSSQKFGDVLGIMILSISIIDSLRYAQPLSLGFLFANNIFITHSLQCEFSCVFHTFYIYQ